MTQAALPPVPHQTLVIIPSGLPAPAWSDWLNRLYFRLGGSGGNTGDWESSQASSGYQRFPGGIILQWGVTSSINSATNSTITFPTAFPSACFAVIPGITGNVAGASAATGQYGVSSVSTSSFSMNNRTSASYAFLWIAVGN